MSEPTPQPEPVAPIASLETPHSNGVAAAPKPTIVLIHGLWMTPLSWEDWIAFFTTKGYTVIAPGWPGIDDMTPEEVRKNPKGLEGLHIKKIVDSYAEIIKKLPSPPIIMGHSFGGLFVQILLSRGYGVAGVALSPAPPSGILALKLSTIKASKSILTNPLTWNKAVPITESDFHYNFGNHLDKKDSKVLWEKYSVPAAAHVLWQGALGAVLKGEGVVSWGKEDRAPLLLICGTNDHVVPQAAVDAEKKKYFGPAIVEEKAFKDRTHGIVNQAGWQEVAEFSISWVEEKAKL